MNCNSLLTEKYLIILYNIDRILRFTLNVAISIKPGGSFSMLPDTFSCYTVVVRVGSLTMLLALFPVTGVATAICPPKDTVAILFIIYIFPFVTATIGPFHDTFAIHAFVQPLASVLAAIKPAIAARALKFVVLKISFICISI